MRILQDLHYALRALKNNPGFTLGAATTMALGIGINTALFTLINAVILRPTPVPNPKSLYEIASTLDAAGFDRFGQNCRSCGEIVAMTWVLPSLGTSSEVVHGNEVSPNYFTAMAVKPHLGRFFSEQDTNIIVLNYDFWERKFQADPEVLGRTIKLSGRDYIITGVAQKGFFGTMPLVANFWTMLPRDFPNQNASVRLLMRLKPGVSQAQTEDELTAISSRFSQDRQRVRIQSRATLIPLNSRTAGIAAVLMVCVGMVLLIACANVANLMLARAAVRQREMSVRLALGASRGRLLRQLLTESMAVAVLGGILAIFIAIWTLPALSAFVQSKLPALWGQWALHLTPDFRVFAYTAGLCAAAGALFGLAPALHSSRLDVSSGLKDGGSQGIRWKKSRFRSGLVVVQVMLCLILLINAGLLARSLANSYTEDPGFDVQHNLIVQLDDTSGDRTIRSQMLERIASVPGVESVAVARHVPLLGSGYGKISRTSSDVDSGIPAAVNQVGTAYFRTLGIAVLSGRSFTPEEERGNAAVAVLSEAAARKLFPGENPIGKSFTLGGQAQPHATAVVIGVARDTRSIKLSELDPAHVYLPIDLAHTQGSVHYLVRTRGEPTKLLPVIRQSAYEISRGNPLLVYSFDIAIGFQRLPAEMGGAVAAVLGMLALVLAVVGIYGVISYSVSQRTREIGIRIALGATVRDVKLLVLRQGMFLAGIGIAAGMAGAVPLALVLRSLLHGVSPLDPLTFCAVPAMLVIVAGAAMWAPTRRATRVEPLSALHHE
ncbi:MAG TPA: ABC transporter permease [Bryobacteraceae bacterium]